MGVVLCEEIANGKRCQRTRVAEPDDAKRRMEWPFGKGVTLHNFLTLSSSWRCACLPFAVRLSVPLRGKRFIITKGWNTTYICSFVSSAHGTRIPVSNMATLKDRRIFNHSSHVVVLNLRSAQSP